MDHLDMPLSILRQELGGGRISSAELTAIYLERIERHNRAGAMINAVRETSDKAVDLARTLDEERSAGRLRGPLHGIPIIVKDNIATSDGMRMAIGSIAFADFVPPREAFLVERLRSAGAIILGKANLTEFTDIMSDVMPSEFSAAGGRVRNPYGFEYGRGGGSSVGSAAAVAAGFCAASIGSETVNSIQAPACATSLVGLKPTVQLVSRAGIVPNCLSQDVAGPMTRTVRDAAILLGVIAGCDPDDSSTMAAAGHVRSDYAAGLRDDGLVSARIGVPRAVYFDDLDEDEQRITEASLVAMRQAGAILVDPVAIPTARQVAEMRSSVMRNEFRTSINAWLRSLGELAPVRSLEQLIEFNRQDPDSRMPYGQALFEEALSHRGTDGPAYHSDRFRDMLLTRSAGIDAAIDSYRLDSLVAPQARAAKLLGKAGYPAIAVPAGYKGNGRPVGLTFFGRRFSEALLLRHAHGFEVATNARRPPRLD